MGNHSTVARQLLSRHKARNGVLIWLALGWFFPIAAIADTSVDITFLDKASGEKISSRIEFTKPISKAPRPRGSLAAGRQLLVEGTARFTLTPGAYEFMVRRGPEFLEVRSGFALERNTQDAFDVVVPHKTPMRIWGWHSGDLQSSMESELLSRWMRADDLDIVATTSVDAVPIKEPSLAKNVGRRNGRESSVGAHSEVDRGLPTSEPNSPPALQQIQSRSLHFDRPGQAGVLVHRLTEQVADASLPSSFEFLKRLESPTSSFVEITRPWERDLPLLLSTDRIDAIQLLSSHLQPDAGLPISSNIRNPDSLRFKGKKGLARLSEHIYWQMLDAGFRIPPTAGSGFDGKAPTHLGYNRVYAWLGPDMPRTSESWWSQLRAGYTMVTNGPLLRATINGLPPGSIYPSYRKHPVPLDIELELTVRDRVEYLDVVFNGKAIYQAKLEDHMKRGEFPSLGIQESGWLVLRVVTEHEASYRMATTAPFYFEFDGQPRISKSAVRFFQDWFHESRVLIEKDTELHASYQEPLSKSSEFWNARLQNATTE